VRQLIRANGTFQDLPKRVPPGEVERLISAEVADTIVLRHMGRPSHIMVVDDTGMVDRKPVNKAATALYWQSCAPGCKPYPIHGDVVVLLAEEFP
jgi:hypothetical protein